MINSHHVLCSVYSFVAQQSTTEKRSLRILFSILVIPIGLDLGARGPQLWIFIDVILESSDFWLDSEIPESILVIPVYQIRACRSYDS